MKTNSRAIKNALMKHNPTMIDCLVHNVGNNKYGVTVAMMDSWYNKYGQIGTAIYQILAGDLQREGFNVEILNDIFMRITK